MSVPLYVFVRVPEGFVILMSTLGGVSRDKTKKRKLSTYCKITSWRDSKEFGQGIVTSELKNILKR